MPTSGEYAVLAVALGYLVFSTFACWRFIAKPLRSALLADIAELLALRRRSKPCNPMSCVAAERIGALLRVDDSTKSKLAEDLHKPKFINLLSWSMVRETEALQEVSIAQRFIPYLLTDEEVTARLVVAREWLAEYEKDGACAALGLRIDAALGCESDLSFPRPSHRDLRLRVMKGISYLLAPEPKLQPKVGRALLGEALVQSYARPGAVEELTWHRKTALVLIAGLTAVVLLAFFDQAAPILLFGAFGALLLRLWKLVYERAASPRDPIWWSTLFLAPVAGALAAVGGLYLITFLHNTGILGYSFDNVGYMGGDISRIHADDLAVAFLFGFSAQLLGSLVSRSASVASAPSIAP